MYMHLSCLVYRVAGYYSGPGLNPVRCSRGVARPAVHPPFRLVDEWVVLVACGSTPVVVGKVPVSL